MNYRNQFLEDLQDGMGIISASTKERSRSIVVSSPAEAACYIPQLIASPPKDSDGNIRISTWNDITPFLDK
jgi:hypothetical protein